jgi:hypothetical protein
MPNLSHIAFISVAIRHPNSPDSKAQGPASNKRGCSGPTGTGFPPETVAIVKDFIVTQTPEKFLCKPVQLFIYYAKPL